MAYPLLVTKLLVRLGVARHLPRVRRLLDGPATALRYCSDRLLAAPLDELAPLAAALEPDTADTIDLTQGTPRFDLLPSGTNKLPADRRGWPPVAGLPELRQAIAAKLMTDNGIAVAPDGEILVTAGTLGAVQTALDTFVNWGDRVVLADPTSPLYPLALRTRGARISWLTTWLQDGRTRFRLEHLARALRGAKMLILTSPANPTGGVVAPEDLEQIAWWAEKHDVLLFSDEVFERFQHDGEQVSLATLQRARTRTLTAGSVSKGHALLAAARVGWLAGPLAPPHPAVYGDGGAAVAVRADAVATGPALVALKTDTAAFRGDPRVVRLAAALRRRAPAGDGPEPGVAGRGILLLGAGVGDEQERRGVRGSAPAREEGASDAGQPVRPERGRLRSRLNYAADDGRLQEGLERLSEFVEGVQETRQEVRQAA